MNNFYKKWTNDEEQVIIGMRKNKCSVKEIADVLGRSTNAVKARIFFLRKKGILVNRKSIKWNEKLDKEVVNTLHKNPGNLRDGFREFANKHNVSPETVSTRYYKAIIDSPHFIFSLFGKFRKSKNRKNYKKEQATGHKMWNIIKAMFN